MADWFEYGYWGLFFASFAAATILPFSSEALLSLMIYADYNIAACLVIATMGNWLGGMTSYYLGYLGKWSWLEKYMGVKKTKIERFHQRVKNKIPLAAFLCWLPAVGDLIAVSLGFLRAPVIKVALFMLAGKMIRYVIWALITFQIIH